MKKKNVKPNLPKPEISHDSNSTTIATNSANEELYNKFIGDERVAPRVAPVTKTRNEKYSIRNKKKSVRIN